MGFLGLGGDKETTRTQTMGREDQAYQRWLREQAMAGSNTATGGGPWAQGANEWHRRAGALYNGLRGNYADMIGMGQDALGLGMQTGFGGIGAYANPAYQQYVNATAPQYRQRIREAFSQGGILASAAGQPANANVRGELFRSNLVGNQMNARQAELGQAQMDITQNAMQAMMNERDRLGRLGYGMFAQGTAGKGGLAGEMANFGQMQRGIGTEQAMDPFNRARMGLGLGAAGWMGPMEQTTKDVEKGNFFGDLMSVGLPIAGMLLGGPAGAAAGASMSGLTGSTAGGSLGHSGSFFGGSGFGLGPSTTFMSGGGGLLSNFPGLSRGGY